MAAQPRANPALVQPTVPPPPNLGGPPPDIASLESIKSRVNQLIESIQTLASLLEIYHPPPPWPDLLAKYAVVMAQTHNLSRALASSTLASNTALHPRLPLSDAPLDGALIPLLRNQQTTDVLRAETTSVRRLTTALMLPDDPPPHAVLDVVAEVVAAHDARADRAQRAVAMLREKYDWRVRVAVDPDEVWGDDEDMDGGPSPGEAPAAAAPKVPRSPARSNTSEEEASEEEEVLVNVLGREYEDVHMAEA